MLSNQIIQKSLEELNAITKIELDVYDLEGTRIAGTSSEMEVEQCFPEKRSMGKSSVIKFNAPAKSTTIFYVR